MSSWIWVKAWVKQDQNEAHRPRMVDCGSDADGGPRMMHRGTQTEAELTAWPPHAQPAPLQLPPAKVSSKRGLGRRLWSPTLSSSSTPSTYYPMHRASRQLPKVSTCRRQWSPTMSSSSTSTTYYPMHRAKRDRTPPPAGRGFGTSTDDAKQPAPQPHPNAQGDGTTRMNQVTNILSILFIVDVLLE